MIIGLTGGIASGKSLVSGELKKLGAHIIDADIIAREIVEPGSPAYDDIVREFGAGILNEDSTIDRKALGKIVFADKEKLHKLNRITHPRIIEKINGKIKELNDNHKDPVIIVDIALLIEVGLHKDMTKVMVVYSDEKTQIERLRKRDNLSEEEAQQRLKAQMPMAEKLGYADYVIDNTGTAEQTKERVKQLYSELKKG
ncbi:MAG: dephospho-CoA kinase [Deltaproteobacteria bacterium]|nr:dephospho-CoA kinase [Deltaproteobacteria bacterium]